MPLKEVQSAGSPTIASTTLWPIWTKTCTARGRVGLGLHGLVDDPEVTASRHTTVYCRKWAPDLERDPVHRVLDRIQIVFPLLMFAGLFAVGGLPWLIWGGFVRSVLVLHTTWLVNSATHVWGYRTYADPRSLDESLVGRTPDFRRGMAQ